MREDLLHYIWKYRKYPINGLKTSKGETVNVKTTGTHNQLSGPDFFNATMEINGQLWAGNVELHIKSSDWYTHKHQEDSNYDNVILHVVWEDDVSVYRKDGTEIPTLALQHYIPSKLLTTYQRLFYSKNYKFINCEKDFNKVDGFIKNNWLDGLYVERLEQKSILIKQLLNFTNNDWEQVLFLMLLKSFGSKINSEVFLELGKSIDFSIIRKLYNQPLALESLLMGQAGFLNNEIDIDPYYKALKEEYSFLKNKYQLEQLFKNPEFFRLRPSNFPTIRLAQVTMIYSANNNLFHLLIEKENPEFSEIFNLGTSEYWETHYNFGKKSKKSIKKVTNSFIDLILINTVIPLKFCYQQYMGDVDHEWLFKIMSRVKSEENNIILKYKKMGSQIDNAKESQSYLQLHNEYCAKDKCLDCAIGAHLMNLKV